MRAVTRFAPARRAGWRVAQAAHMIACTIAEEPTMVEIDRGYLLVALVLAVAGMLLGFQSRRRYFGGSFCPP
jgi:hypothetical protein